MKPKTIAALAALFVPASALLSAGALAQDHYNVFYQTVATDPPPPPPPPTMNGSGHPGRDPNDAIEARLEAARQRLEEAARQVADLSSELYRPDLQAFSGFEGAFGQAIIGVQLDRSGGKDGAHVVEVSPGGPADEAGIGAGDVIVAVNGKDVKGEDPSRQVTKIIRDIKPDSKLSLRVLRAGKPQDFAVTPRPGPHMPFGGPFPDLPDLPPVPPKPFFMVQGPLSSMELASLTPRLGKYFGTDKGVLVVRAPPDGALKLEDGDVILAIDGRQPTSGSHATRILGSYQPGEKIVLRIVRERKSMDLETTVPEALGGQHKAVIFLDGRASAPAPGKVVVTHREDAT